MVRSAGVSGRVALVATLVAVAALAALVPRADAFCETHMQFSTPVESSVSQFRMCWQKNDTSGLVDIAVEAKTAGWIAVGFYGLPSASAPTQHAEMDLVIVGVKADADGVPQAYVHDGVLNFTIDSTATAFEPASHAPAVPTLDSFQGSTGIAGQAYPVSTFMETTMSNGPHSGVYTSVRFSRPAQAQDPEDVSLERSFVIAAYALNFEQDVGGPGWAVHQGYDEEGDLLGESGLVGAIELERPADSADSINCNDYCHTLNAACGGLHVVHTSQFFSNEQCLSWCHRMTTAEVHFEDEAESELAMPIGAPTDLRDNSLACRQNHAFLALSATDDQSRNRACVAAGPTGGQTCGTECEVMCVFGSATCGVYVPEYANDEVCHDMCVDLNNQMRAAKTAAADMRAEVQANPSTTYPIPTAMMDDAERASLVAFHDRQDYGGMLSNVYNTSFCRLTHAIDIEFEMQEVGLTNLASACNALLPMHHSVMCTDLAKPVCPLYCDVMLTACDSTTGATENYFSDVEDCMETCSGFFDVDADEDPNAENNIDEYWAFDAGELWDTGGNTLGCRIHYARMGADNPTQCETARHGGPGCTAKTGPHANEEPPDTGIDPDQVTTPDTDVSTDTLPTDPDGDVVPDSDTATDNQPTDPDADNVPDSDTATDNAPTDPDADNVPDADTATDTAASDPDADNVPDADTATDNAATDPDNDSPGSPTGTSGDGTSGASGANTHGGASGTGASGNPNGQETTNPGTTAPAGDDTTLYIVIASLILVVAVVVTGAGCYIWGSKGNRRELMILRVGGGKKGKGESRGTGDSDSEEEISLVAAHAAAADDAESAIAGAGPLAVISNADLQMRSVEMTKV